MTIAFTRYALYSHPYTDSRNGRTEICCLECREDSLPVVVWAGERVAMNFVMGAIGRHEEDSHSKVTAAPVAV